MYNTEIVYKEYIKSYLLLLRSPLLYGLCHSIIKAAVPHQQHMKGIE